jgi:tetratricopeptide (TPR) repeat protein
MPVKRLKNSCGVCLPLLLCLTQAGRTAAATTARSAAQGSAVGEAGAANNPADVFRQGKEALQKRQLELAERCFLRVIALDPKSSAAYVNLGVTYMRQKRWDDALAQLRKAETLSPGQPGISLNIGLAYYRKNDFTAAIAPFSAVLERTPESAQARYLLGLCYFFTNRFKESADALSPLWEKESTNLNYLYVLGIAASKSRNPALEKQAFDQMILVGQGKPEYHIYLGKARLVQGDTDGALAEFHAAADAQPNLPMVHYFLGRTYLEQHAYPQAEAELLKDAALEPQVAYNYEDLGILYVQLNQPEKAEKYFRHAIETNSTLVNSYFGLAKLYRQSGRYQVSLTMLDRAEALAPQSASVHYLRGQVLAKLGEAAKAKQEFETSAKLLKSFNDRLQEDPLGERSADAQDAAQQ